MEALLSFLKPLLEAYAGNFGWAIAAVAYVGTARLIIKPLVEGIKAVVLATPGKSDDEFVAKIEANKFYVGFMVVLNWLASINLKPKA
jgi:hypothetical protein